MSEWTVVIYGEVATLGYVTAHVRVDGQDGLSGYFIAPRDVPFNVGEACRGGLHRGFLALRRLDLRGVERAAVHPCGDVGLRQLEEARLDDRIVPPRRQAGRELVQIVIRRPMAAAVGDQEDGGLVDVGGHRLRLEA